MKKWALISAFLLSLFISSPGFSKEPSQEINAKNIPLVVEARQLTYNDKEKTAVYIGNVTAQRGKTVIKGDKLFIYFDKTGKYIEKIKVTGNVHIVDPRGEGWCKVLYYYPAQEKVVLSGNAKLKQKKNLIIGDVIVAYKDGRVSVEGIKQKVKTVIYPGEKSEQAIGLKPSKSGKHNKNLQQKKSR